MKYEKNQFNNKLSIQTILEGSRITNTVKQKTKNFLLIYFSYHISLNFTIPITIDNESLTAIMINPIRI